MSFGLSDDGELALLAQYFDNKSVVMGVYRDSVDNLDDTQSVGDITTEPQGSNYGREAVETTEVSVSLEDGSGLIDVSPQTFNVSDSNQKIDAAFLFNPDDGFFLRLDIDTSSYPNEYIPTSQLDNLRLGGDALTLE